MKRNSILTKFSFEPINLEEINKFNDEHKSMVKAKNERNMKTKPEKPNPVIPGLSRRHEDPQTKAVKKSNSKTSAIIHKELSINTELIAKATAREVGNMSIFRDLSRLAMSLKYKVHDREAAIRSLISTIVELPFEWIKAAMHGKCSIKNNILIPNLNNCSFTDYERQKVKLIRKLASFKYLEIFLMVSSTFREYMESTKTWSNNNVKIGDLAKMFDEDQDQFNLEKLIIEFNKVYSITSMTKPFNFLVKYPNGCTEFNRQTIRSQRHWHDQIRKLDGFELMSYKFKNMLAEATADTEDEKSKRDLSRSERTPKRKFSDSKDDGLRRPNKRSARDVSC